MPKGIYLTNLLNLIKDNFKDKLVILVAHQVVKGVFDTVIELDNKV